MAGSTLHNRTGARAHPVPPAAAAKVSAARWNSAAVDVKAAPAATARLGGEGKAASSNATLRPNNTAPHGQPTRPSPPTDRWGTLEQPPSRAGPWRAAPATPRPPKHWTAEFLPDEGAAGLLYVLYGTAPYNPEETRQRLHNAVLSCAARPRSKPKRTTVLYCTVVRLPRICGELL